MKQLCIIYYILFILFNNNNLNATDNFNIKNTFEKSDQEKAIINNIHEIVWNDEKFNINKSKIFRILDNNSPISFTKEVFNRIEEYSFIDESDKPCIFDKFCDIKSDLEEEYYPIEIIKRMLKDNKFKYNIIHDYNYKNIKDTLIENISNLNNESKEHVLHRISELGYDKNTDDFNQYVQKCIELYKELQ